MKKTKQSLSLLISYSLVFMPLHAANLEVDGSTNTTLDSAGNGVPVVNIANPNATGLSHNRFNEYNVGSNGLILNNSRDTTVNTQLGGHIYGNTNLSSNARVILNEVTSTSRSQLNGYTEVAGQRADLVIANPNGITINGAGFINTSNITLTTGTPLINNGAIDSFNVLGGDILIEGDGLDATLQDSAYIYTHYLRVNAAIHAKNLDVRLGKLDSSALGGMYANRISLVGTEQGLGVNLPPEVLASSGDITITNDGMISLQKITAKEDITVQSNSDIELNNNAYATNITLDAKDKITNNGNLSSKESLNISSTQLENKKKILVGMNEDESINGSGVLKIDTDALVNSGSIQSTNISDINTKTLSNSKDITASNTLNITATDLATTGGEISATNLEITTDTLTSTDTNILAVEDLTIEASSKIDNGGVIQANKTVNIKTKILNNTNSLISEDMIVNADSINNDNIIHASNSLTASSENITNRGTISGSNLVKLDVSNKIDNQNSKILSLNSLEISSKELNNANGKIKSNVDSSINTNHINNTNGNIESVNNLTLTTETIDLDSSDIYAGKNLTLKLNALDNIASSSIEAGAHLSINAASHITNDSALLSNGLITLTTDGALTNTNTISSASGLNINADSLVNNVTISGGTGVSKINIVNDIENNSRISSAENLEVSAKNITNDGFFNAGQDLTITSDNLTNNKTLFSGKDMILYTKDTLRNNEDANIYAVNNLTMSANSANDKTKHIINDKATIQTYEGDINIYAESLENITDDAEIETIVEETNILELALCGGYYYDSVTSGYDSVSFTNTCTGSLQYLNDIKADLVAEGKAYTEVTDVWKYSDGSTSAYTHQNEEQGLFINNVFYPKSELISYSEEYGKVTFQYKDLTGKDTDGNPFVPKKIKYIYADGAEVTSILNQYYNQFGVTVTYDAVTRIGNLVYGEKVHHIKLTPNNRETKRQYNTQVSRDQITLPSQKSKIASGKDLNLHLNNGRNYLSEISAVNIIDFDVDGNFINKAEELFRYNESTGKYYYCASDCSQLLHDPDYEWAALPSSSSQESIETIFSTIQAGVDITGDISSLDNSYTITQIAATTEQNEQTDTTNITRTTNLETIDSNTVQISDISVPTDNYGLFVRSTNPNSNYLIETNPEFALYENFISSDYMMEHIDYDSEATTRRLGDAFYENTLIRDSIFAQTGRRFLDKDINSDLEQYKRLMDNAIQANKDFELSPGIALNKEQINALKQDIVWMEEQIVAGEKVLVPVVYIAYVDNYKLEGAQIIAGRDVDLKVDTLTNSGSLSAGANMSIEASDSIDNYGGLINADEDMKLLAKNDITNTAGTIKAKNIDITSTDGNIVNQRFAEDVDFSRFGGVDKQTLIGEAAKIVATNTLNISAKENILVQGSELNAKDINLNATNVDITTTVDNKDYFAGSSGNYIKEQSTTHLASNINADNININSTGITSVTGSNLNATENLNVTAKKIDVVAVNNTTYNETKISSEGMFKSSSTTTKRATSTNQASNLSGANVQLTTTQEDIDVVGSNLNAQETLALNSANDVNIDTGYNVDHKESKTVKTSMLSGGDLYSSRMDNIGSYDKTNVASNLNARDITINSKNADIKGSNLNADATVDINADSINIETAQDEHKTWEQHKEISLSFDQAVDGVAKLGAEMATLSLADTGSNDILSTEASYSDTKEQTTSIINQSSNINAGENLSLRANSGDIDVVGSNLNADGTTTLNAAKDVNILSAHDTNNHSYEETSGYIATKITTDEGMTTDIDLTLRDETENNSNAKGSSISSGNNLTLISANDTNIIGSDLSSGGDTSMQTGGELTIATAKNTASTSVDNLNIHIHAGGIPDIAMGDGQVEAELGRATLDKIKKTTTDTTVTSSNVNADESINLTSEKSILVEGSNLNAKEEVTLIADEDVTIKEAKETSEIKSDELHGVATAKFVVANEYAKIPYAVKAVEDAKDGVKDAKKSYSNYKKELSSQKTKLAQLKQDYKDGVGFIELVDVEEFEELVDDLSDDDKYYQANIALAGVTLATKSTALAAQIAKAAASSATYGFSAGIELDIDAIEKQLQEQSTASIASNIKANVIKIQANNKATIQGSTLDTTESIDITATNTDILASKDNYDQSEDTQHQNVNISISTAGFSMSASADNTESNTNATTNANAQLLSNNININTKETTNIVGANVNAQETLALNTKNLNVASVQDTSKTKEHSIGISAGFGADGLSSLGANTSNASSKTKETILTNLTAKEVNINVDEHTDLKGATIASVDENGEDNGNLNFKTDTLTASSLNNTHNSKSTSVGLHVGASREQDTDANLKTTHIDGASTVAIDYTNDRTNSKTKTLATLGSGNIQIGNAEDSDTKMLNRDVENNTVDIYDISSHKGLKGELDTRLVTTEGRAEIANDIKKSKVGFIDVAKDIINSESLTVLDSFTHQGDKVNFYDGMQKAIKENKDGARDKLADPNLTQSEKDQILRDIATNVASELKIELADVSTISTDKQTADGTEIQGGYHAPSGDIAINDKNINSTGEAIETLGHELAHHLDNQRDISRDGTTTNGESYSDEYANVMGESLKDYAEFGMWNYSDGKTLADTNTHNGMTTNTDNEKFDSRVDAGEIDYRQYVGIRGGDPVKATEIKALNNIKTLAGQKLLLNASGEGVNEIKNKANQIAVNGINNLVNQTLVQQNNPQIYINEMVNILGEDTVQNILNDNTKNDMEKIKILNQVAQKQLSYNILNTDSSIITVGEKVLEKDNSTKTMIFESGKKEQVAQKIINLYEKDEQIILQGHSAGGGDVQDIAQMLKDKGIKNVVTIQVDSVEPIGNDASIPDNVSKAINVYETKAPSYITGEDNIHRGLFNDETEIINKKFNNIKNANNQNTITYHTEIDNDPEVRSFIENEVIKEMKDAK